jgi:hypothetical protein
MLLWLLMFFGVALGVGVVAVAIAMRQAERQARRTLYRALGYDDKLIDPLMAQKGPVSTQLALIRKTPIITAQRSEEMRGDADRLQSVAQGAFRYTRALNGTRASHQRSALAARHEARPEPRDPS